MTQQPVLVNSALPRMATRLTPEQQLLMDCVCHIFGIRCDRPLPVTGEETWLDWDVLVHTAFEHGLAPLAFAGLSGLDIPIPAAARKELQIGSTLAGLRTRTIVEPALAETLATLQDIGVKPIVLKGAALAYSVYPEPAQRTMADLDVLLHEPDIDRARAALEDVGFWTPVGWQASYDHQCAHAAPLFTPDSQISVELHHDLLLPNSAFAIELEPMMARTQRLTIAGVSSLVLAPADALLHACVHLAENHEYSWFPLRTLVDIFALITRSQSVLDWDLLLETVQRSHSAGVVYWPLQMSRNWLGAPVPEYVMARLAPPAPLRGLIEAVVRPAYILAKQEPAGRGDQALHRAILNLSKYSGCSARTQLECAVRSLFPLPEHVGFSTSSWSSWLKYLTYIFNPARVGRGLLACGGLVSAWRGRRSSL